MTQVPRASASPLISSQTWYPDLIGMLRSSITRPGRSSRAILRAVSPSSAVSTRYPSLRATYATDSRMCGSSSQIRTFFMSSPSRAPWHRLDDGVQECFAGDRLGQDGGGTLQPRRRVVAAGDDHRDVAGGRVGAQPAQGLVSSKSGHHQVHEDEVGAVGSRARDSFLSARGAARVEPRLQQKGPRRLENVAIVIHLSLIHISEPTRLLSISYAVFC